MLGGSTPQDSAMARAAQPITFVVSGQAVPAVGAAIGASLGAVRRSGGGGASSGLGLPGKPKCAALLGARRAGGDKVRLEAVPGEDVVVLHLSGGPALVLHPETARDLLLGQGTARRSSGGATPGVVEVPAQLRWSGLEKAAPTRTRGFLGDVLLQAVEVFTGFLQDKAVDFAQSKAVQIVDGAIDAGVYPLQRQTLDKLSGGGADVPASTEPILVLLHGTFVDTKCTFGALWVQHPDRVRELFDHYGGRVHALDHPTISASPLANALTLVRRLPKGARLHLLTHSRGGLVGEVLARLAGRPALTAADLAFFAGPAYAEQRKQLKALASEIARRHIQVERVVRVACPARGTLLASRRLDAYLSVLKWSLDLSGVPVAPTLVGFLAEVARRRADPMQLPGLAAMVPDSPLVQWLNHPGDAIPGELRVVAGDLEGDSVGSWLKTLAADAFYWTDNDIVVHTRSMYGGTPRAGGASFVLDQGGRVTHFDYFVNTRTVDAVVAGLRQDKPAGYRPIGPLSWAGDDAGGLRAPRRASTRGAAGAKPAVLMLPGILGSHLAVDGRRIWLGPWLIGGLGQLAWAPGSKRQVTPDGMIGLIYDDLAEHLAATHEVIPFAFDWRRPIEEEARRLADAVTLALDARKLSGLPVRLLAHSMGGLVARTMQFERPKVWQRLLAHPEARLVMLGTPNGGSWAPMQVLSGDDTFGNALAAFGAPMQDRRARQLMAEMPGFMQLQAELTGKGGLASEGQWRSLAEADMKAVDESNWWHRNWLQGEGASDQLSLYEWGVPPQKVLDQALALRERLDRQRDDDLPQFADRLKLVVGQANFTPDGYTVTADGMVYLDAVDGGDGRVTHGSALLPGVSTWVLEHEHGTLPDAESAFEAFTELLCQGQTVRLPRWGEAEAARRAGPAASRPDAGAAALTHVHSRPSRGRSAVLPALDSAHAVLSAQGAQTQTEPSNPNGAALRVELLNGNLSFIGQPLMLGHYRSGKLTGTEAVLDRLIGGTMSGALDSGQYPETTGSSHVFVNTRRDPDNPWRAPRPLAAVVVGLGEEGELKPPGLVDSVRHGVISWAQRLAEQSPVAATFELAATLLGSGGIGISAGGAACAIAQGVREANLRLTATGWPVVSRLVLVELYLDRANDAWHGLRVLAATSPGHFDVAPLIGSGTGPMRRPLDNTYRGADYDLISAISPAPDQIEFTLDTRRARTEVRAVSTQGSLVRELVLRASHDANDDVQIGRTLFQLLVPQEMEPFLGGTAQMVLELDLRSAGIPWELLDLPLDKRAGGDRRPWALRTRLLRRLRTRDATPVPRDANADDDVLVIGEPRTDSRYAPLPGARAEAHAVAEALRGPGGLTPERVVELASGEDATTIVNTLMSRRWRIVHISGHGEPFAEGGVVLSDGLYLGAREIARLRTVPEMVFVNCCYLATRQVQQVLQTPLGEFAAGVADTLIKLGVRCVIAAGWAVEDEPARVFAATLYCELLARRPFIDAVATARAACWAEGGNTWAAFQCYGDPGWTMRSGTSDAQAPSGSALAEFAAIASPPALAHALETLATRARFHGVPPADTLERIRHLKARFEGVWGDVGAVAEAFAVACAAARDIPTAAEWYERAAACNDGSASLKAVEQLGNLRVRMAWEALKALGERAGAEDWEGARKKIAAALVDLSGLNALQPTVERQILCASAHKRLAMVAGRAGDAPAQSAALLLMVRDYAAAEVQARRTGYADLFYPAMNRMAGELVTDWGSAAWTGFAEANVQAVRENLQARLQDDPDFWSWVGMIELDLYLALGGGALADALPKLLERYTDLQQRVAAPWMWSSVADQVDFVLPLWSLHVAPAEAAAATELSTRLGAWAGR